MHERMLAYEMVRAVCESNGSMSADEQVNVTADQTGMILRYSIRNELHANYLPEIRQRATSLDTTSIVNLVRGKVMV